MSHSHHQVHGLAADEVTPDWPALSLPEIQALSADYPWLGTELSILWRSPRPLSAAAIVRSRHGHVFIKRHHQRVRRLSDLAEEHGFIQHLQHAGIPIPRLLPNTAGLTATGLGPWNYELSELAQGQDLYRDSPSWTPIQQPEHALQAGRALAQLHLAAAGYRAPQRQTFVLLDRAELIASADPVMLLSQQLNQRPGLAEYIQQRAWQDELAGLFSLRPRDLVQRLATVPSLWTHNDWHVSNLTWQSQNQQDHVCNVLDFGLSARTHAIHDLATAIERNAIAWLALESGMQAARCSIAIHLIEGYNQIKPLSMQDLVLLQDILPLVHVDFALSEVEYFQTITQSTTDADVAWNTFLLGHAQWFTQPPGQALLAAITAGAGA